jgi:hypothetical protein
MDKEPAQVRAARRARLEALVAGVVGAEWATFVTSPPNSRACILDAITFTLAGYLTTVAGVSTAMPLAQPVATLADLGLRYRHARGLE